MPDGSPTPLPIERTLDGTLGFRTAETSEDRAVASLEVTDGVRQPFGLLHGGVLASLAESLASRATFEAVWPDGMVAMGLSNSTSFLRPVTGGEVRAEARRRHRGRTTWVWDVDFTDDSGALCAVSRVTTAVRPAEGRG